MFGQSSVSFTCALQNALYVEWQNLNKLDIYKNVSIEFSLNWSVFEHKLTDQTYKEEAYYEFKLVAEMGFQGFPSVVLEYVD